MVNTLNIKMKKLNQQGNISVPIIAIIAAVAVLAFILLTTYAPFKSGLTSQLYQQNSTYAAKSGGHGGGGTGGSSTLSLVLLNSTDGLPHFGQQVTFTVSTTVT